MACSRPALSSLHHASDVHQVKELEQILRRRNPNSLPALIYAAAAADSQDKSQSAAASSHVNALLERRTQRLEAELERRDEEAKCSLRAMEQQFHRVKVQQSTTTGAKVLQRRQLVLL